MEFDPFDTSQAEKTDDKEDKKRKKRVRFGVPVAQVEETAPPKEKAEKPQPRSLAEELIEVIQKEKEATAEKDLSEGKRAAEQTDEQTKEKSDDEGARPEVEKEASPTKTEAYEELPLQEIRPNELGGGEFVLRLNGDEPVAERVIPLRAETVAESNPVEAFPEASEPVDEPLQAGHSSEKQPATEAIPTPELFAPEAAVGGGGGEEPPTRRPEGPAPLPERPEPGPEPATPPLEVLQSSPLAEESGSATLPDVPPTRPASERPATKQEVEDALHRSAQIHEQRGLLGGLFFGTYFANRRLRRRQLRESKELSRQGKQIEQLSQELHAAPGQENQLARQERRLAGLEKRFENPVRAERLIADKATEPAKLVQNPEHPEQLQIPEDHRLETSAWHAIEVDNKTGRPVEAPTFQYGHEYYRERAQEATPALERNAAAGEVALVAASGAASAAGTSASNPAGTVPPAYIPDASRQGSPSGGAREKAKSALNSVTKSSPSAGPIWPWVVALVVVVVLLAIVLH